MISSTIGDMSRQLMLSRQSARMQESVATLSKEMTTGVVRDKVKHLNGDLAILASLDQKIEAAGVHKSVGDSLLTLLSGQQRALENIHSDVERISTDVLSLNNVADAAQIERSTTSFRNGFESTVGKVNTTIAGRSIFAGVASDRPALASADVILSELKSDLQQIPSLDSAGFSQFIDDWFAEDGRFDEVGYLGGVKLPAAVDLGDGIRVNANTTAEDQAFRTTLAGLAKGALLGEDSYFTDLDEKRSALDAAAYTLLNGASGLIDLSARIGIVEERTSSAITRAGAEETALSIARAELLSADPHETAIQLENAMTQLDLIFAMTARLSRLTLADYLR